MIEKIEIQIKDTENIMLKEKQYKKMEKERDAIKKINTNPKLLFSIMNKKKGRKNIIGPLKIDGIEINKPDEIVENLLKEYKSQFNKSEIKEVELFEKNVENGLHDIEITPEEIIEAIDDLDENSAAGPDGIPALLLKETKKEIVKPLGIILRKSLDEGKIPDIFKMANITPIHKGGSKFKPSQYRPVSLTSHIMKVFERIIKKYIIQHLTENKKFNTGQHGFKAGRSTQTQLLSH